MSGKDNIKVAVRVRPLNSKENGSQECVQILNNEIILESELDTKKKPLNSKISPKTLRFDYVADHRQSQKEIFNQVAKEIVENCLEGYNGTIFAYGQTGSGKTFTIQGLTDEEDMQSENRGIMPRSFEYIFYNLNRLEKEGDFEYLVKCSYLEIYNENIQDLLDPSTQVLKLREDIQKGVYVVGAIEENVRSTAQMNEIIKKGTLNRHISCTEMNKDSSRSHAVMTLKIETKKLQEGVSKITTSSFHIIDLAGSERAKRTGAGGIILKEAGSINKSLSILGNVINCLVEIDQGKKRFVHYRDSKLTYLLKNSLGGNAKTLMIANISPASCSYFETNSTLKFAQRAKMIKNDAVINEDSSANVAQLKNEIRKLKVKIHDLELEKASWQCDLGEEEPKYRSPGTKNRVSEALSEKKALNQHLGNQPRMQFQTFSPSMVSELGPEEATGDAKLVRRVKKLQNLVKLHLEQSIQKDKLYEQEIDKKDVHISKLETTIEEYDKISKKDQMLISSRDKTIAQLKNSSGINLEDFRNHQIDLLKEEKELLEYKISNNPELEGFKSKCSKLKNQIEEMKGDCEIEGYTLKEVLSAIVNLNKMTQEYLTEFCEPEAENQIHTSASKRISDVSFFPIEDKNQLEEELKDANEEIEELKSHIKECTSIISSKNSEIKDKIFQISMLESSKQALDEQFVSYKREMLSKRKSTEQEREKINLDLIEAQGRERTLEQEIENLKGTTSYFKELLESKEQQYNELGQRLNVTKNCFDHLKEKYYQDIKTIQNECQHMALQKDEIEHENCKLKHFIQDVEEENRKLSELSEELKNEISDESSKNSELKINNETLQESYDFANSELEQLQEKLEKQAEEINNKQSKIDEIDEQLESLQKSLVEKSDFQTEYYKCKDQLKTVSYNLNLKTNELGALGCQYENAKKTIENQREKIHDLDAQNNSLKDTNSKLEEDVTNLTDKILEYESTLKDAQQMAETFNRRAERLSKALDKEKDAHNNLQSLHDTEMKKKEEILASTAKKCQTLEQRCRDVDIDCVEKLRDQIYSMERRHKQISEENEKFKEIIDHNQAAIYELEGKEFELQKLLDQKESELQRMLEEVKYASEQQEIMKEKVDSLESQNNNLLSHNNKNQKMKYITKLKEDHNNAIDLSEKYKKELVAVKSKNKKLAAKESSAESKLRKIKSIANQLEQDSSLSLKDAVCLLLQALNSGPVLEDVTNKSYIHQSSSKTSHSKSFSSQKGFSKEESPFLKRSHTQNENLEPFKRNKTLSKETN